MKKTRHIEITAFRRQVTVYSGDQPCVDANSLSTSRDESWPNIEATCRLTIDLEQGCDASLNAARAGELASLAEALIGSGGKTSVAADRLGISQSRLYMKLRKFGVSVRQLKGRLDFVRQRQGHKID